MEFPVADLVEQAVSNQVNAMIGTNNVNMNTIVKMSLLDVSEDTIKSVVNKMLANNKMEKEWIDKEYALTYDIAGNLIPVNDIVDENKEEINLGSIVFESERSEPKAK